MAPIPELFKHQLGRKLREERRRQGLTLGQMAYKSGVSRPYITEVEQGYKEASSMILARLCKALDVYPVVSLHTRKVPVLTVSEAKDCTVCDL